MMIIDPTPIYRDLGQWLRQKRVGKNLSQIAVSRQLGLASSQFISNIERGLAGPPRALLQRLLKVYEIPPTEFVTWFNLKLQQQLARQYGTSRRKVSKRTKPRSLTAS